MADLPGASIAYGRIRGQVLRAVGDGEDAGVLPDSLPGVGKIVFTPQVSGPVRFADLPGVLISPQPVTVNLSGDGSIDVTLVATDIGDPSGWGYKVTFEIPGVLIPSSIISVPSGSDQYLTSLLASAIPTGTLTLVGPKGDPGPIGPRGPAGSGNVNSVNGDLGPDITINTGVLTVNGTAPDVAGELALDLGGTITSVNGDVGPDVVIDTGVLTVNGKAAVAGELTLTGNDVGAAEVVHDHIGDITGEWFDTVTLGGGNLIRNSDFSDPDDVWFGGTQDTTHVRAPSPFSMRVDPGVEPFGGTSHLISPDSGDVSVGIRYTLTAWFYAEVAREVNFAVDGLTESTFSPGYFFDLPANVWTRVVVTGLLDNLAGMTLFARSSDVGDPTPFWVSTPTLQEGTVPTAFSRGIYDKITDTQLPERFSSLGGPLAVDLNVGEPLLTGHFHTNLDTLNRPPISFGIGTTTRYAGAGEPDVFVRQVVTNIYSATVYERRLEGSTWTPWVKTNIDAASGSRDIYISADGVDTNSGSPSSPKKSLVAAVAGRVGLTTRFVLVGSGDHRIDETLVIDGSFHSLHSDTTAVIDAFNLVAGQTALYITASDSPPYEQTVAPLRNIEILGPGQGVLNTIGIMWENGGDGEAGPSHFAPEHVNIHGFGIGMVFGKNAYIFDFFHTDIWNCVNGMKFLGNVNNAGEKMTFHGGVIYNCSGPAVVAENGNGTLNLMSLSLDYSGGGQVLEVSDMQVNLYGCFLETSRSDDNPLVYVGGGGSVNMYGGAMIIHGAGVSQMNYIIQNDADSTGGVFLDGVVMSGTKTLTGELVNGTGRTVFRNLQGSTTFTEVAGDQTNLLADGDMESPLMVDDWAVSADTAPLTTDPHTGDAVAVYKNTDVVFSGTRSMRIDRYVDAPAAGAITLLVPVQGRGGQRIFTRGWVSRPSLTSSGVVDIVRQFAVVTSRGEVHTEDIDTEQFVITAGVATGWVKILATPVKPLVPMWATHLAITFDCSGWSSAGEPIFVDEIIVNAL